jgi:hypothetical protein
MAALRDHPLSAVWWGLQRRHPVVGWESFDQFVRDVLPLRPANLTGTDVAALTFVDRDHPIGPTNFCWLLKSDLANRSFEQSPQRFCEGLWGGPHLLAGENRGLTPTRRTAQCRACGRARRRAEYAIQRGGNVRSYRRKGDA